MSQIPQNRSCWHGPWKRKKKEYGFTYAESFALLKVGTSLFLINAFMKTCGGAVLNVIPESLNLDQNTCFFLRYYKPDPLVEHKTDSNG